ncbi:S8 family serine peptidase [Micromonospora andamanensis]|uniref:S8 family serine peptidase n=1 Tax=Micromonospora andamanensis TaxID=1287068 RepID=UPI00300C4622
MAEGLHDSSSAHAHAQAQATRAGAGPRSSVTLVTGDVVVMTGDGRPELIPAAGRASMPFRISRNKGKLEVVPGDAAALIAAGRLDPRLFDVTSLLAQGHDDTRRAELPLIVQYRPGATKTTISAAKTVRKLPSVNGAAVAVPKKNAPAWWSAIAGPDTGVDKVWLNGYRRLTLDRSAAQIGAPAAWQAGLTGRQVRIAVIDTGIDTSHPDLGEKVVASANFTADPAGDQIGHGTHVASIAAGSAAASGGRYRGIAPDAHLLDAKVCSSDGQCAEDAILAGLEWAAAQDAQVANVSLGGPDSPGVDPIEQAVNTLSTRYGTLFVIAAGNAGPIDATVQSPGSAEAALTVAAVDRQDTTAEFSSRGPRTGDGGLKPDIAAPGVDIVAARATGVEFGEAVDDRYAAASGTSMASPHVAGAAALLFQKHPEWTSEQVKAALIGSAEAAAGGGVFDQGAGRVDVAAAIAQSVTAAPASLGFGIARWPHEDDLVLSKTVTYRNTGSAAVSLDLALAVSGPDTQPASSHPFGVSPSRVVVPAGGSAQVVVTAETRPAQVPVGRYAGRLVATGTGVAVTTPFAVEKEGEYYDVEITHVGRDGETPGSYVTFLDKIGDCGNDIFCGGVAFGSEARSTLRLPPGQYTLAEFSTTAGTTDMSLLMQFVLDVSGDTAVTADARRAKQVELAVPRASAKMMDWGLTVARDMRRPDTVLFYSLSGDDTTPLFTADLGGQPAGQDNVLSFVNARFAEPGPAGDFFASPYEYQLADGLFGRLFTGLQLRPSQKEFATIDSHYAATAEGREFKTGHYPQPTTGRPELINYFAAPGKRLAAPLPFRRTEYLLAGNVQWRSNMTQGDLETGAIDHVLGERDSRVYEPGRNYRKTWNQGVFGPQLGEPGEHGGVPYGVTRQGDRFSAAPDQFVDSAPGHGGNFSKPVPGHGRLYRDGELIRELPHAGPLGVDLSPEPATYRLEMTVTMPGVEVSTHVSTAWTFRSGHVAGNRAVALPLLGVRITPPLNDRNHASAGSGYQVPVQIYRQPTAGSAVVADLTVEISYDDGSNWHKAPLIRDGERWHATVDNPPGGAVSLRVKATDTDGNQVEQTTTRAYLVDD